MLVQCTTCQKVYDELDIRIIDNDEICPKCQMATIIIDYSQGTKDGNQTDVYGDADAWKKNYDE